MARRKRAANRLHAAGAVALVAGLVLALSFLPGATGVPLALSAIGGALLWVNISLAAAVGGVLSTVQWTAAELVGAVLAFWQLIAGGTAAAASIVTSSVTGITHAIWRGGRAIRERVRVLRQPPPPHPVPRPADAATAVTPRAVSTDGGQRVADPVQGRDRQLAPGTGAGEAFKQETLALEVPSGGYQLPP